MHDSPGPFEPHRASDRAGAPLIIGRVPTLYTMGVRSVTFVERADHWRAQWATTGYPPGVEPKAEVR